MAEIVFSKCGFRCDRCPAYKDNSGTEAERERGAKAWKKYFGLDFKPGIVKCEGCRCEQPWKNGNILPDRSCIIRSCAVFNSVPTCAHCSGFPCKEYSQKVPGVELRNQREQAGKITISDTEYLQYLEPFDGRTHLKELRATLKPAELISPAPFSAGGKIVPFPSAISRDQAETAGFKQLYDLIKLLFSQTAATYAGQVLLERRKPYIGGILWVMGYYGRLEQGKLTVESEAWGDKKECNRLVRKGDNRLHNIVRETLVNLDQQGLVLSFTPRGKKAWVLTLSTDTDRLKEDLLPALKSYTILLAGKYGEPVYVHSYDLKGKAYKLFMALDMSIL